MAKIGAKEGKNGKEIMTTKNDALTHKCYIEFSFFLCVFYSSELNLFSFSFPFFQ